MKIKRFKRYYTPRQCKSLSEWVEGLPFDEGSRFLSFCWRREAFRQTDIVYRTTFEQLLRAFWREEARKAD